MTKGMIDVYSGIPPQTLIRQTYQHYIPEV